MFASGPGHAVHPGCMRQQRYACCGNTADAESSTGETSTETETASGEPLNVGVLVSTVGIPALYADEQGWFDEAGLNVNLIIFATGAPVNEAIAAKELDIACSGFASVYSLANADCTWLLDINSTGGMGIFAREDSPVVAAGNTVPEYPSMLGSAETVKGLQILAPWAPLYSTWWRAMPKNSASRPMRLTWSIWSMRPHTRPSPPVRAT